MLCFPDFIPDQPNFPLTLLDPLELDVEVTNGRRQAAKQFRRCRAGRRAHHLISALVIQQMANMTLGLLQGEAGNPLTDRSQVAGKLIVVSDDPPDESQDGSLFLHGE